MDGDGQHAVSDIDKFVDFVQDKPPCVLTGDRMKDPKGMPLIRYLTNRFILELEVNKYLVLL